MKRVLTAAALATAFAARYPQAGVIDNLSAGEEAVGSLEAQAARSFNQVGGKLKWVKCTEHFREAGEVIEPGEFVQMREHDANGVVNARRAVFATDEEVAAAQEETEAPVSKAKK